MHFFPFKPLWCIKIKEFYIFLQKYLRMSKKSSTFAPAFVKSDIFALLGGDRFSRLVENALGAIV